MSSPSLKEFLLKARSYIEEKEWIQHRLFNYKNPNVPTTPANVLGCCTVGGTALASLFYHKDIVSEQGREADEILASVLSRKGHVLPISYWNDMGERTREEVLQLYDEAIKSLEAKEHGTGSTEGH